MNGSDNVSEPRVDGVSPNGEGLPSLQSLFSGPAVETKNHELLETGGGRARETPPYAAKRPWSADLHCDEQVEDDMEESGEKDDEGENLIVPDLADYFRPFQMDVQDIISVCRTYASHLASGVKAVKRRK